MRTQTNATGAGGNRKRKFRKFRDDRNITPEPAQKKIYNNNYLTKLVKSIKRRCALKNSTPGSSNTGGKNYQNKFLQQNKFKPSPFGQKKYSLKKKYKKTPFKSQNMFQPTKLNAQQKLTYGLKINDEIITCLDDDTDDDCVVIETTCEKIVIDDDDDDVPTTSSACMTNNTHLARNKSLPTQFKAEESSTVPTGSFFYDCFKTKLSMLSEKPFYSTELPKLTYSYGGSAVTKENIIVLDESYDKGHQNSDTRIRNNNKQNEAVTLEIQSNENNNFLPLVSNDVPNPIIIEEEQPRQASNKVPPINKLRHSLFTAKEQKDLNVINCNAYNPAAENSNAVKKKKKRTVLVDGSNVAFAHSLRKDFSVEGLKICIDYFDKLGHDVKAVVPMFRKNSYKTTNPKLLDELQQLGKVIFTPCKNLPGLVSSSYDDRFIVQLACELDAAIISNDNYRDIIHESTAFKKLIENRVIGYTWCDDIFMLPKDPYGRFGPTLEEILNRL